jgi:hypothetical protein
METRVWTNPYDLTHRFFYSSFDGYWFRCYAWVTTELELLFFDCTQFQDWIQQQKISRNLLIELGDKANIELYLKFLDI